MIKRFFLPLHKAEEQADGTMLVTGIASSEAVDSDGEVISAEAVKAALPDFFKYGTGALREMHQAIAAGTVDKAEVTDGVTYIEATVVDPVSITKLKHGVFKGFSIGGRATQHDKVNKKLITGLRLTEVSLVDRPANPDAVIQMYKAEGLEGEEVTQKAEATALETAAVNSIADMLNKGTVKASDLLKAVSVIGVADAHAALMKACGDAGLVEGGLAVEFVKDLATERDTLKAQVAGLQKVPEKVLLKGELLTKGMYGLRTFADLLQQVAWLTQDTAWEANVEGDSSKLPQQLRDWLAQGANIFSAMSKEEVDELVASVTPPAATIVAAEQTGDLSKAAASDSTAATATPAVVDPPAEDPVAKALAANTALAADLRKALGAIDSLRTDLTKANERIAEIEKQPLPGKALLKAIGKGADIASPESTNQDVEPVRKADGTVDDAATAMKAVHARGGMSIGFK